MKIQKNLELQVNLVTHHYLVVLLEPIVEFGDGDLVLRKHQKIIALLHVLELCYQKSTIKQIN